MKSVPLLPRTAAACVSHSMSSPILKPATHQHSIDSTPQNVHHLSTLKAERKRFSRMVEASAPSVAIASVDSHRQIRGGPAGSSQLGPVDVAMQLVRSRQSVQELKELLHRFPETLLSDSNVIDATFQAAERLGLLMRGTGDDTASHPEWVFRYGMHSNPETSFKIKSVLYFSLLANIAKEFAAESNSRCATAFVYAVAPPSDNAFRGPHVFDVAQFAIDAGIHTVKSLPENAAAVATDILKTVDRDRWMMVLKRHWNTSALSDDHYAMKNAPVELNRLLAITGGAVYRQKEIRRFKEVEPKEIVFAVQLDSQGKGILLPGPLHSPEENVSPFLQPVLNAAAV